MSRKPNRDKLFAYRLTGVMEEHEVTVDELAEVLESESLYAIELIEGKVKLDCLTCSDLRKICNCCNCSADYLLGLSDNIN